MAARQRHRWPIACGALASEVETRVTRSWGFWVVGAQGGLGGQGVGIVATAYLAYSARLLSQTLALLNDADADR